MSFKAKVSAEVVLIFFNMVEMFLVHSALFSRF